MRKQLIEYAINTNVEKLSEVESKNLIIEKADFTADEIKYLAKDYYTKHTGIEKEKLCHILNADNLINVNNNLESEVYIKDVAGTSGLSAKTIYLQYRLAGDGVYIYD